MGATHSIKQGFQKTLQFSGRTSRPEFWTFALFVVAVPYLIIAAIMAAVPNPPLSATPYIIVFSPFLMWLSLPSIAVRRARDAGRSAIIWVVPTAILVVATLGLVWLGWITPLERRILCFITIAFSCFALLSPPSSIAQTLSSNPNEVPS